MISNVIFKSNTDEWTTPDDLYQQLNAEFEFNLDPCSTDENHKTAMYYTKREDGLKQPWGGAECGAIHHTAMLKRGSGKHITKHGSRTRLL